MTAEPAIPEPPDPDPADEVAALRAAMDAARARMTAADSLPPPLTPAQLARCAARFNDPAARRRGTR